MQIQIIIEIVAIGENVVRSTLFHYLKMRFQISTYHSIQHVAEPCLKHFGSISRVADASLTYLRNPPDPSKYKFQASDAKESLYEKNKYTKIVILVNFL